VKVKVRGVLGMGFGRCGFKVVRKWGVLCLG
jgi:hypothetical protein